METFNRCLEVASSLLGFFASLVAFIISFLGLWVINTWKKEHIGRKKIDVAQTVLSLFYEAREDIKLMREPFKGLIVSFQTNIKAESGSSENKQNIPSICLKDNSIYSRLLSIRFEFMALFGEEYEEMFLKITNTARDVAIAHQCISVCNDDLKKEMGNLNKENLLNYKDGLIKKASRPLGGETDHLDIEVNQIVSSIEKVCKPILLGRR